MHRMCCTGSLWHWSVTCAAATARAHHDRLDLRGQLLLQVLLLCGQRSLALCGRLGLALQGRAHCCRVHLPQCCEVLGLGHLPHIRCQLNQAERLAQHMPRPRTACSFRSWSHSQAGCTHTSLVPSRQAPCRVQVSTQKFFYSQLQSEQAARD